MQLHKPFFVLAPMDDVTDTVFRQIVASCAAPDLFFTEFVNVDGLQSPGRPKLLKKLKFVESETNLIAQLWGLKPENFEKTARELADGTFAKELGLPKGHNFIGIDINMGCPAKSEVKNGTCSALIKNRPLAHEIIEATKKGAGNLPVSVKTRLGFSEIDLTWHEFLLGHELDMLTVHFRTRKEMSKVPAHWEYAHQISALRDKIAPNTKIVGNGDVLSREQGLKLIEKSGIDAVMIGRGVFHDPYLFSGSEVWPTISKADRLALFERHVRLFAETWKEGERPIHTLNKFCKIYVNDFEGAKELREQLMATESTDEVLEILSKQKDYVESTIA